MLLSLLPAFALLASVSADLIDGLPSCWESCAEDQNLSCDGWDLPCICKASKGTFLTDTVSCARSNCDTSDWNVQLFLGPLELLCATVGESLPRSIIKAAENCATQTAPPKASSTKTAKHASSKHRSDKSQNYITTTYTTTITETTTDKSGSTVYVIIPVIVEPSTMIYGKPSTSVARGFDEPITSDTILTSTLLVSPSPLGTSDSTPAATTETQAAQTQSESAAATSSKGKDNSNGTPFYNPQAAASTQERSWVLALFGLLVVLF